MSNLVYENPDDFKYIIRVLNTNLEGRRQIAYSLTAIKGIGRRMSFFICNKARVDPTKRAGELNEQELEEIQKIMADPRAFGVPDWFINRRRDFRTGLDSHVNSNMLDTKIREDIERMKKAKQHRGLRHLWLLKVRGQMTKSTGRKGVTIGVVRKGKRE